MRGSSESGFSLLELTVATMLTIGLLGAIFSITGRNQQVFVTEFGVTDMNQNVRTAADLITRDIQSAGMGLDFGVGNFAAIFYKDGASNAPDSIMMVNGDPFAPSADVYTRNQSNAEFLLMRPADVKKSGSVSNPQFTYVDGDGVVKGIYKNYSTDARNYIVYDDKKAMIFRLSANANLSGSGSTERVSIRYTTSTFQSPATLFGSAIDTGEPALYDNARVGVLGSTIAYKLDTATNELKRTEDLQNWYTVARGVVDFQVKYRVLLRNIDTQKVEEKVTSTPGDGTDATDSGRITIRRDIRSVIVTITAETPDAPAGTPSYRRVTHRFEATPRNLNLTNNVGLRSL